MPSTGPRIPVYTSGCVTKNREGKELAGIEGMRALGVKMLTDDGDTTNDPAVLLRAMQYATEFGMFFSPATAKCRSWPGPAPSTRG